MKYGFIKTKLDGTEHRFGTINKVQEEFRYTLPKVLDQGSNPICVPCSISAYLNWDLNSKDGNDTRDNNINVQDIFKHGGKEDGMLFKDAFNYLISLKKLNIYALVGGIEPLKTAIELNGPCVAALPVYNSTSNDFWNGAEYEGGHAISIVGWNKEGFIIRNSWGQSFGDNGYTTLPYSQFNKFIEIWTLIK